MPQSLFARRSMPATAPESATMIEANGFCGADRFENLPAPRAHARFCQGPNTHSKTPRYLPEKTPFNFGPRIIHKRAIKLRMMIVQQILADQREFQIPGGPPSQPQV